MPRLTPPSIGIARDGSEPYMPSTPEDWNEIAVKAPQDTVEDFLVGQWRDSGGDEMAADRQISRALAHAGLSTDWR